MMRKQIKDENTASLSPIREADYDQNEGDSPSPKHRHAPNMDLDEAINYAMER